MTNTRYPANEAHGDETYRPLHLGYEQCTACWNVLLNTDLQDYGRDRLCSSCIEKRGLLTCAACHDLTHREDSLVIGAIAFCCACSVDHECTECGRVSEARFERVGQYDIPLCVKCAAVEIGVAA